MLEDKEAAEQGQEKGRGMAFVELEFHESALYLVRAVNNLKVTEKARGIIVEFSIEDHRTLLKRRQRYEKRTQIQEQKKKEERKAKRENQLKRLKTKVLEADDGKTTLDGKSEEELKAIFKETKSRGKK